MIRSQCTYSNECEQKFIETVNLSHGVNNQQENEIKAVEQYEKNCVQLHENIDWFLCGEFSNRIQKPPVSCAYNSDKHKQRIRTVVLSNFISHANYWPDLISPYIAPNSVNSNWTKGQEIHCNILPLVGGNDLWAIIKYWEKKKYFGTSLSLCKNHHFAEKI